MRRAQDRSQLREEEARLGQAEPDGAQAERRIGGDARQSIEALLVLVGAQVERANRHWQAVHARGHGPVSLELLVLGRQSLAIEKQELGAEEPDARRAVFQDLAHVVGQLDIREQLDAHAVDRLGGLAAKTLQLLPLEIELALLQPVFGEHRTIGVDDHHTALAVHDQHFAVADQLPRVVRRDDRGHVETARDDRRMRGHAAQVGEERAIAVVLELDHVRGREVVRDEDRLLLGHRRRQRTGFAHQALQHPLADLDDVRLAFAQVRVFDLLELLDQDAHLLGERPLGVAALLVQDHPVDVQKRAEFAGHVAAGHRRVEALQFLLDFLDREAEARNLGLDLRRWNVVVSDLERRVRDELRPADRDAGRDADTMERETDHHRGPRPVVRSVMNARRNRRGRVLQSRASRRLRPARRFPT